MFSYIVTVFDGEKERALSGVPVGQSIDLSGYECRRIYPKDWEKFKSQFSSGVFNPEITSFLDSGFEIRIYRKRAD